MRRPGYLCDQQLLVPAPYTRALYLRLDLKLHSYSCDKGASREALLSNTLMMST